LAVITGASKGLGKAMALALGRAGARLALVSRSRDSLEAAAAQARASGAEAEVFVADVSDEARVKRLENETLGRFGPVHILSAPRKPGSSRARTSRSTADGRRSKPPRAVRGSHRLHR
jgi:short-subunit dehydrogenase